MCLTAMEWGATDFINPTELADGKTIQQVIVEMTEGGVDYSFEATGNVQVRPRLAYTPKRLALLSQPG